MPDEALLEKARLQAARRRADVAAALSQKSGLLRDRPPGLDSGDGAVEVGED